AVANSSVSGENRGYAYDAAWNLHYRTNNATVGTFLVDGKNQLTNAPSYNLSYDGNGNPTGPVYAGASTTLAYDDENRLISFSSGGNTSTFAYDGLGRLRTRSDPSGVVNYIYDGMRVIQERDGSNGPQVSYTRGLDLSGTFEGAGGIGGLLARSHDFTLCTNMLTVRMTNGSPYLVEVWLYHSDTAVDFYQGNGWWLVPDLANAEVYAEAVQVPPDDYRDFTFEAVGGREYDLYGHGDYYYVQEFYVPITATLENYQVGLVPLGNDLDWNYGESGNVLCGEDLTGRWLTHTYYHADGNGNITCLVNANQAVVASYRYDPYGNTLAQSGPLAEANTYRFSSKEFHAASELYYYGYRFYDPRMQRWVNRDPLEERGFEALSSGDSPQSGDAPNLYLFNYTEFDRFGWLYRSNHSHHRSCLHYKPSDMCRCCRRRGSCLCRLSRHCRGKIRCLFGNLCGHPQMSAISDRALSGTIVATPIRIMGVLMLGLFSVLFTYGNRSCLLAENQPPPPYRPTLAPVQKLI
ncbi:MAG: hypothetical protein NT167_27145, partial [Verrucomicrobia bacterium]|nr:hypothetical protein [Verrucomicrobiota bacterium]